MALKLQNLENHSGSGSGLKLFSYDADGDDKGAVQTGGYFNDASSLLSVGDRIAVHASDADFDCHVSSNASGVVIIAAVDNFA